MEANAYKVLLHTDRDGGEEIFHVFLVPAEIATVEAVLSADDLAEYYMQAVTCHEVTVCQSMEEVETLIRKSNFDDAEDSEEEDEEYS